MTYETKLNTTDNHGGYCRMNLGEYYPVIDIQVELRRLHSKVPKKMQCLWPQCLLQINLH